MNYMWVGLNTSNALSGPKAAPTGGWLPEMPRSSLLSAALSVSAYLVAVAGILTFQGDSSPRASVPVGLLGSILKTVGWVKLFKACWHWTCGMSWTDFCQTPFFYYFFFPFSFFLEHEVDYVFSLKKDQSLHWELLTGEYRVGRTEHGA